MTETSIAIPDAGVSFSAMRSPVEPHAQLVRKEIEPGLLAYECPTSGGVWIPLQAFLRWKDQQPVQPVGSPEGGEAALAGDSDQRALICPESGRLLLRYRVGHGLHFHVDRSPATGGVWLDRGEWDALKSQGLHTQLHLIFTSAYQRQVRTKEYAQMLERTFRDKIGDQDYARAVQIKEWLAAHPRRDEICCYLLQGLGQEDELAI